jgi:hypothetical protein
MGFFFPDSHDRISHTELKKQLKSMKTDGHLSSQRHDELLEHFENHRRDDYSAKHIHEILRKKKDEAGDSFNSDQIERAEGHITGAIHKKVEAYKKERELKAAPKETPKPKLVYTREYKTLNTDSLEVPPQSNDSKDSQVGESLNDRFDKAA